MTIDSYLKEIEEYVTEFMYPKFGSMCAEKADIKDFDITKFIMTKDTYSNLNEIENNKKINEKIKYHVDEIIEKAKRIKKNSKKLLKKMKHIKKNIDINKSNNDNAQIIDELLKEIKEIKEITEIKEIKEIRDIIKNMNISKSNNDNLETNKELLKDIKINMEMNKSKNVNLTTNEELNNDFYIPEYNKIFS